jgi:hypothetical protein
MSNIESWSLEQADAPQNKAYIALPVLQQPLNQVMNTCRTTGSCGGCGLCCEIPEITVPSVPGDPDSPLYEKASGERCPQMSIDPLSGLTRCRIHDAIHNPTYGDRFAACRDWVGNQRQPGTVTYAEQLDHYIADSILTPTSAQHVQTIETNMANGRLPAQALELLQLQLEQNPDVAIHILHRYTVILGVYPLPYTLWNTIQFPKHARVILPEIQPFIPSWLEECRRLHDGDPKKRTQSLEAALQFLGV